MLRIVNGISFRVVLARSLAPLRRVGRVSHGLRNRVPDCAPEISFAFATRIVAGVLTEGNVPENGGE
jgi:hypothetical protein